MEMTQKNNENINFSLFLNKPYHIKSLHDKMLAKSGDKQFRLSNRFDKEKNFVELQKFDFSGIDCKKITDSQKANIEALFLYSKESNLKPEWRLTLGLGGASIFDTDITLHHIYGVPYIPASSIKGVVRSYIIEEEFNNDEASAIMNKDFCDIFGCSKKHLIHKKEWTKPTEVESFYGKNTPKKGDRKGQITFFDALPINSKDIHISMDIMNVHYKDYYNSEKKDGKYEEGKVKPPADWSNPNIINFLTVKNTTFQFLLASKDTSFEVLKIKDKTIDQWLKDALENHGIGAKTAVGYGYMSE
jgi:CRISPR-associated protein Cmr6